MGNYIRSNQIRLIFYILLLFLFNQCNNRIVKDQTTKGNNVHSTEQKSQDKIWHFDILSTEENKFINRLVNESAISFDSIIFSPIYGVRGLNYFGILSKISLLAKDNNPDAGKILIEIGNKILQSNDKSKEYYNRIERLSDLYINLPPSIEGSKLLAKYSLITYTPPDGNDYISVNVGSHYFSHLMKMLKDPEVYSPIYDMHYEVGTARAQVAVTEQILNDAKKSKIELKTYEAWIGNKSKY